MARKVYDVVAVIGTYTNRNGEEKKRYLTVGAVFESDRGLSMKLEAIPVGGEFNGWLSFFEPKERDEQPKGGQGRTTKPKQEVSFHDDDIPF